MYSMSRTVIVGRSSAGVPRLRHSLGNTNSYRINARSKNIGIRLCM